jgi:hypothetical protein
MYFRPVVSERPTRPNSFVFPLVTHDLELSLATSSTETHEETEGSAGPELCGTRTVRVLVTPPIARSPTFQTALIAWYLGVYSEPLK